MNNYETMLEAARERCAGYDMAVLAAKPGVEDAGSYLRTNFFAQEVLIHKKTAAVTVDRRPADFGEGLSVYDWLCDRKADAAAAGEFCVVSSLPGVVVGGSGLSMAMPKLAGHIHKKPQKFRAIMESMGAVPTAMGDLGYRLCVFPDFSMCLKFYFGDEEFQPELILLWDRNSLRFVRYETLYYIAGCLQRLLLQRIQTMEV